MFWVRSVLESGKKIRVFNLGGSVLGKVRLGLWEEFQFGGGVCSGTKFQNRGVLENLVKIFWKPSLEA